MTNQEYTEVLEQMILTITGMELPQLHEAVGARLNEYVMQGTETQDGSGEELGSRQAARRTKRIDQIKAIHDKATVGQRKDVSREGETGSVAYRARQSLRAKGIKTGTSVGAKLNNQDAEGARYAHSQTVRGNAGTQSHGIAPKRTIGFNPVRADHEKLDKLTTAANSEREDNAAPRGGSNTYTSTHSHGVDSSATDPNKRDAHRMEMSDRRDANQRSIAGSRARRTGTIKGK